MEDVRQFHDLRLQDKKEEALLPEVASEEVKEEVIARPLKRKNGDSETNVFLENVALLQDMSAHHAFQLESIEEETAKIESRVDFMESFVDRLESERKQAENNNEDTFELSDALCEDALVFQREIWPSITQMHASKGKSLIKEHRNPFPEYTDITRLSSNDVSEIVSRFHSLMEAERRLLGRKSNLVRTIFDREFHLTNMASEQLKRSPYKKFVENQRTS